MNPLNTESIHGVSGVGCATSDHLEDLIEISIRVDEAGIIDGVRCRTFGCVAAVACGSVFSEMLLEKNLTEAAEISANDVLEGLGGLPPRRACYAKLPILALEAALENHRERMAAVSNRGSRSFVHRRAPRREPRGAGPMAGSDAPNH
jgi:nitrogen fixation NifU-like protein